ncbi:MAG: D-ribose pyranase [Anaerolineales bacterium]|nr:D-ribose pyranase [Anaerolineales bacterium]
MKKTGILNQDISRVVAGMGHTDMLVIADAGLPIPAACERIDVAIGRGIPDFFSTVEVIVSELQVESIILAEEMRSASPELYRKLTELFEGVTIEYVSHEQFKTRSGQAKAIVRTGEFSPFANVILISGVVF